MHLVYIYPTAQAPDYKRPTDTIKAYILNEALDTVVDKEQVAYKADGVLWPMVNRLIDRNPEFVRTEWNVHMAKSVGEAIVRIERDRSIAVYLTPDKTAELLSFLEPENRKKSVPLTEAEEQGISERMSLMQAEEEAEVVLYNKRLQDQLF